MRHLSTRRFRSLGAARKPHDAETQVAGHNVLFRRVDHSNRGDWSPEHRGPGQVLRLPSDGIDLVEGSRVGTVGNARKT